ncbi:MAG: hypothetical protein M3441_01320 [Chloroflexota bacterium]|nr:hypothetical protein [Chloroflexota bacterium]
MTARNNRHNRSTSATARPDSRRGREIAEFIFNQDDDERLLSFEDPFSDEFAVAAIQTFIELYRDSPGVLRKMVKRGRQSARSQNEHPFHGITEMVQNADDQGATLVSIAVLDDHLLLAHNGRRVNVHDVLPIAFPFLTTKSTDAKVGGRFGIGLKTLDRLGKRLSVHSSPYHFSVTDGHLALCTLAPAVLGLYDPQQEQTLLDLHLHPKVDLALLSEWLGKWDASSLLFLRSVRTLCLVNPLDGDVLLEHRLIETRPKQIHVTVDGQLFSMEEVALSTPDALRSWMRYTIQIPVQQDIRPSDKAVDQTTPLSLAIPEQAEPSRIFVGLPTQVTLSLPFDLNAQFEPTTDREGLQETEWNRWLFQRFRVLTAAVIQYRFTNSVAKAWISVPLSEETRGQSTEWLEHSIQSLVTEVHDYLRQTLRIRVDVTDCSLSDLVYEAAAIDGLLSPDEQKSLCPQFQPLLGEMRDVSGRWRTVLADLRRSTLLSVRDALTILSWDDARLASKPMSWYLQIAAAAIISGAGQELSRYRCILTSYGERIQAAPSAGYILVQEVQGSGLGEYLGLVRTIHEEYLTDDGPALMVRKWLEQIKVLSLNPTPEQTLEALISRASSKYMELDVDALRMLRDLLSTLDEISAARYGSQIGRVILVDGYQWREGSKVRSKVRPSDAYQPPAIDKQPLSWAHAAGKTPNLWWLNAGYGESLSGERRASQSGPSTFFRLLGADIAPRPVQSPATARMRSEVGYSLKQYREPSATPPPVQVRALNALSYTADTLLGDHLSPDLSAVARDISFMPVNSKRRHRARALLFTLSRAWATNFATYRRATAAYSYNTFNRLGQVPATWIADLASLPWLSNYDDDPKAPYELAQATRDNQLVYAQQREKLASEIEDGDSLSVEMLLALEIAVSPSTTSIVAELERLRDETRANSEIDVHHPNRLYEILAYRVSNPNTKRVGDMQANRLKGKFGIDPDRPGLVYADGGWFSPNAVFLEPRIFGTRRPFVSDNPALRPLWTFLGVRAPSPGDCIAVLTELTRQPPSAIELSILLDTYRHLERELVGMRIPRTLAVQLASLPLWKHTHWSASRPVYATDAPDLRAALSTHVPTWEISRPSSLPHLASALGVTVLQRGQFHPIGVHALGAIEGHVLAPTFRLAVQHLQDRLAERSPELHDACSVGWKHLQAAQILIVFGLSVKTEIAGQAAISLKVPAHLELLGAVPTFYVSNSEVPEDPDSGGAVIASLFPSASSEASLELEWALAWRNAKEGRLPKGLQLAEPASKSHVLPPAELPIRGRKERQTSQSPIAIPSNPGIGAPPVASMAVPGRQLKILQEITIVTETKAGADKTPGHVKRVGRRGLTSGQSLPASDPPSIHAPILYRPEEKEDIGVRLLRAVLEKEGRLLYDHRRQPGVGADLMDDLGHYYELKVHGVDMPDEVTVQDNQLERAWQQGANYTLVVISGVETGQVTQLKLFPDPLHTLNWKANNSKISLSGVLSKEGNLLIIEDHSSKSVGS